MSERRLGRAISIRTVMPTFSGAGQVSVWEMDGATRIGGGPVANPGNELARDRDWCGRVDPAGGRIVLRHASP
jgi:hypothetical protein